MDRVPQMSQPINETPTKCCTKCGGEHPLTNFHKRAQSLDGLALVCKDCMRAYCKANSERRAARARQWNRDNTERVHEWTADYIAKHGEEIKAKQREAYREKRKDPNFREAKNEYRRDWYHNKGGKIKDSAIHRRRYRQMKANGGELSREEWETLLYRYGGKCLSCGATGVLDADHVIPVSKGGPNDVSNRQPLCRSCNVSKRDKVIDFRPDLSCLIRDLDGNLLPHP